MLEQSDPLATTTADGIIRAAKLGISNKTVTDVENRNMHEVLARPQPCTSLPRKPLAEGFPSVQSSAMENAVAVIKDGISEVQQPFYWFWRGLPQPKTAMPKDKDFKPDSVTWRTRGFKRDGQYRLRVLCNDLTRLSVWVHVPSG